MLERIGRGFGSAAVAALLGAAAVLATPAGAHQGDLEIFTHNSGVASNTRIGVGGDGSLVLYSSTFSFIPPENLITADDLVNKPFLSNNVDLFSWSPDFDLVGQFTATSNIENTQGTGYLVLTANDQVALTTKTADARDRIGSRAAAIAFRSNADQAKPGPTVSINDVDSRIASLGPGGHTIFVWDSDLKQFNSVFQFQLTQSGVDVGNPTIAMKTKGGGVNDLGFRRLAVRDVWVAFDGTANPAQDNGDGNSEIFLWTRSDFLAPIPGPNPGVVNNGGVVQVTHTLNNGCFDPTVNEKGDVAFLSDEDLTGDNPDGSIEVFVWSRRRMRQVTNLAPGDAVIDLRFAARSRRLVFSSTTNFTGDNPENNFELFTVSGRRVRQITRTTTGDNFGCAPDDTGRAIAFLSDADLPNVTLGSGVPEVVTSNWGGRAVHQVTETPDGGTNDPPFMTKGVGSGWTITFVSDSNLDGRNSNQIPRIYRAKGH
jgi:hypothetical protein